MYPRFGMAYTAIQTAQAQARVAQLKQQDDEASDARAAVFPETRNAEISALWRMAAAIAVILAVVVGAVAWFAG